MTIDNRRADQPASQPNVKKQFKTIIAQKSVLSKRMIITSRYRSACTTKESGHLQHWPILQLSLQQQKIHIPMCQF